MIIWEEQSVRTKETSSASSSLSDVGHTIEAEFTDLLGVLISEVYRAFSSDDPQTPFS